MSALRYIARGSSLVCLIALLAGCVIAPAPREGYYDRPHHRYYHDHDWHECHEHDRYCR
jgi:hypothetical protein